MEITRRANRRIHGVHVVESFGDILIRSPEIPESNSLSLVPFELYDDMTPGGTGKYVWTLNSDYSRNTSAGHATVQVSDSVSGDIRAYGSSHSGFSTGAKGWYTVGPDGTNQIVRC